MNSYSAGHLPVTVRVWVLCSHWVIQHSLISFCDDSGGVPGPGDSGSRSTSGDTGEGELRTGSIEVRVHFESYFTRNSYFSCIITRHIIVNNDIYDLLNEILTYLYYWCIVPHRGTV